MGRSGPSRDAVEFVLPRPSHRDVDGTRDAAIRAFGMSLIQFDAWKNDGLIQIRCRPSQFARFLIYRAENISCNRFKELEAKLVPGPELSVVDVTKQQWS